jgi:hypothetical protein
MIQLERGKTIQGKRKITAKELNKEICAKELKKGLLKSLMETCFVMVCQILDLMVLDFHHHTFSGQR